jgi:hypothetical protein
MTYEIEKGIPVSPIKGKKKPEKYPFSQMEPGDSFLVLADEKNRTRLRESIYYEASRSKIKIRIRSVESGLRVWRK